MEQSDRDEDAGRDLGWPPRHRPVWVRRLTLVLVPALVALFQFFVTKMAVYFQYVGDRFGSNGDSGQGFGPPSDGRSWGGPGWGQPGGPGFDATHGAPPWSPDLTLLLVAGPIALLFRRRYPLATLIVTLAITAFYFGFGYPLGPAALSAMVAIFNALGAGLRRTTWIASGVALVVVVGGRYLIGMLADPLVFGLVSAGWLVVALLLGEAFRIRAERAADRRRNEREAAARKASEQRLAIARELHDVLAHNISLINVQSGVALHLIDRQPERAAVALAAIKEASKEALTEMRTALQLLRGDEPTDRQPAPGLDRLDELAERMRAAGLDVVVRRSGTRRSLPGAADLAAYRIVQEALTNTYRHAGPATAEVTVDYADAGVRLSVVDNGKGPIQPPDRQIPPDGEHAPGGRGLAGMRERATALGGTFSATERAGGGFEIHAYLPAPGAVGGERQAASEPTDVEGEPGDAGCPGGGGAEARDFDESDVMEGEP